MVGALETSIYVWQESARHATWILTCLLRHSYTRWGAADVIQHAALPGPMPIAVSHLSQPSYGSAFALSEDSHVAEVMSAQHQCVRLRSFSRAAVRVKSQALPHSSLRFCRHMLYGEWDYQEWRQKHLPDYLKMCGLFKGEVEEALGVNNRPYTHVPAAPVEGTHRDDAVADSVIKEG